MCESLENSKAPYKPSAWLWPLHAAARGLIVCVVWGYRCTLGHFMGGHCRHSPTCSQYMLDAVAKYGPWRGGWRGLKRILRCHPWGTFGHDPA